MMNRPAFLPPLAPPAASAPPIFPSSSAGLVRHTAPLDQPTAAHLLRRTRFGASPGTLSTFLDQPAADAADQLVAEAVAAPLPDPPEWVNEAPPPRGSSEEAFRQYRDLDRHWRIEWETAWISRLYHGDLREKMTLFWHNHFVTEQRVYRRTVYSYRYLTALRTHALGNFRDFVRAIGLDPAMLIYLNGTQNRAGAPNENYARELMELFTMGQFTGAGKKNYEQEDIEEIARALTGWVVNSQTLSSEFRLNRHDDGQKTIFGRAGTFGYEDVVDLLFEERATEIAEFICRKLYREFVYAGADEGIVSELAGVFLANNFEIAPVVQALLGSTHFFDEQVRGAQIKSPTALIIGLLQDLDIPPTEETFSLLRRLGRQTDQRLLNPPNVAGWPGHHTWISTTTFTARWNYTQTLIDRLQRGRDSGLVPLAEALHDPADPLAAFTLPTALAEHLLSVPLESLNLFPPDTGFAGDLINNPIPDAVLNGPAYVLDLAQIFLGDVPWYEWSLQETGAPHVISSYVQALKQLPEFQLT
ncbi:MAG: DUF1800 family protein [Rhodothermales bacterium]